MAEFILPIPRTRRLIRKRRTFDSLSNYEVRKNCGMSINGVRQLIEEIGPGLAGTRTTSISVETKVLIYLSYLRSGTFQWSLGTMSNTSQKSVSKIIAQVTTEILKLRDKYVKFPTSDEERMKVFQGFHAIAGIPKVVGVIDGTHVSIIRPREHEDAYVNRKFHHSINTQVVVDHQLNFIDVVAKWPGSTHDSFIFKYSSLYEKLQNGVAGDGTLLGDSGYAKEAFLQVPLDSPANDAEKQFNKSFKKTRCTVERAIGTWKSRFRAMCQTGGTSCYAPAKVCRLIVASCILHNFCNIHKVPLLEEDEAYMDEILLPQINEEL